MSQVFTTEIVIQASHLDSYGHVNHARYLEILEDVRWLWLKKAGITWDSIHQSGVGPTILEVNIAYKRELKLWDRVKVETQRGPEKGKIFEIHQKMLNPAGEVAAEITLKCAIFDLKARKIISIPELWTRAFA